MEMVSEGGTWFVVVFPAAYTFLHGTSGVFEESAFDLLLLGPSRVGFPWLVHITVG